MKSVWTAAFLAAMLASAVPAPVAAESPATQPDTRPSPSILALVQDLTSDQFSTRELAQKKLEQLGQEAAPQLQEILKESNLSDEAAARIRSALQRIHEQRQFGPSVITIHCHDAPLAGVLKDFANQADADLGVNRPEIRQYISSRKISLDLDRVDFWTALRAVEDGSGLHGRPNNGNGAMILDNFGGWFEARSDRARVFGPCLIAPQAVNWSIQFGQGRNITSNLSVQLAAMIEPKMQVVGALNGNWLRHCIDDKGHELVRPGPDTFFGGPMRQWWIPLSANLQVVPGMGTRIAKLTGELAFNVQTKSEVIEVDDLSAVRNLVRVAGETTITIQKFAVDRGQYQLQLSISGAAAASGRWDIAQNLITTLQVLDEKGQPLQLTNTSSSNMPDGKMTMTMGYVANAPAVGPPKKLRWEITTEIRPMSIPFELDDIDLPHAADEGH